MSRRATCPLAFALFLLALDAQAADLAVLDLEARGVSADTARTLTDVVAVALKGLGVFDVVASSDLRQMLNFEQSKQVVGCTANAACIAEIGGALGVARLVSGSLAKLGESYILTLSLIDAKTAKVLEREARTVTGEARLVAETEAAARFVVRRLLEKGRGELVVEVSEADAEIEIDGKLLGLSPMPRVALAAGPHTVRISKKGFISHARDVTVEPGRPLSHVAMLVPSKDFIEDYDRKARALRIGAWVGVGVGAALIGTGIGLWFGYNDPRFRKYNADAARLNEAGGAADGNEQAQLVARRTSIATTYTVAAALGVAGGVVGIAATLLFLLAPAPGVYDRHKMVEVGGARASFEVLPTPGGAAAFARLSF